jgi:hypothetical protein
LDLIDEGQWRTLIIGETHNFGGRIGQGPIFRTAHKNGATTYFAELAKSDKYLSTIRSRFVKKDLKEARALAGDYDSLIAAMNRYSIGNTGLAYSKYFNMVFIDRGSSLAVGKIALSFILGFVPERFYRLHSVARKVLGDPGRIEVRNLIMSRKINFQNEKSVFVVGAGHLMDNYWTDLKRAALGTEIPSAESKFARNIQDMLDTPSLVLENSNKFSRDHGIDINYPVAIPVKGSPLDQMFHSSSYINSPSCEPILQGDNSYLILRPDRFYSNDMFKGMFQKKTN